jgi:F420-dependent oxidoreductase-like protein
MVSHDGCPVRLGLNLGYSGAQLGSASDLVHHAESLGFDAVWVSEAWGADAITPLAYLAATTDRIRLGTAVMQLAGRTPAMCAMQVQTVDALSGGRVIAGLGLSGPQVVEGWHGQPWGRPYHRMRDYVSIMRRIFDRDEAVSYSGTELSLPYSGPGAAGVGKALRSMLHTNRHLPIWIGTGGDSITRLAGELAQGLLPMHFTPADFPRIAGLIADGFGRAGNGKGWDDFEIVARVPVRLGADLDRPLQEMKEHVALLVGGMGGRDTNFHKIRMAEAGHADAAERVQELFMGDHREAAARAVPDEYADSLALLGEPERIRERYRSWAGSGLTGLRIETTDPEVLELMAELATQVPAIGPAEAARRLSGVGSEPEHGS